MENGKLKIVYIITENKGKSYWNRVGVAFVNRDGSLNVQLNALPIDGKLHIRDYVPRDGDVPPSNEPETTSDNSSDEDFPFG